MENAICGSSSFCPAQKSEGYINQTGSCLMGKKGASDRSLFAYPSAMYLYKAQIKYDFSGFFIGSFMVIIALVMEHLQVHYG